MQIEHEQQQYRHAILNPPFPESKWGRKRENGRQEGSMRREGRNGEEQEIGIEEMGQGM